MILNNNDSRSANREALFTQYTNSTSSTKGYVYVTSLNSATSSRFNSPTVFRITGKNVASTTRATQLDISLCFWSKYSKYQQ